MTGPFRALVGVLVVLLLGLGALVFTFGLGGAQSKTAPAPTSTADPGWTKTAGQTTCADWMDRMDIYERKGLALAMLKVLWEKAGAGAEPSGELAVTFANDIGAICGSYRAEIISTVGSSVYPLDSAIHP